MASTNVTQEYLSSLRGIMSIDSYIPAVMLVHETDSECKRKQIADVPDERLYEMMLSVADKLGAMNPFKDKNQFARAYKGYCELPEEFDWEMLMMGSIKAFRYPTLSTALFEEYERRCTLETGTVLVAECDKFIPNLKKFVDKRPGCTFILTAESQMNIQVIKKIFSGYENVEIVSCSIYKYEFINSRFDLTLSVPNFGVRNLSDDENFMCRDQDAVALENLLLHTINGGELIITMPARFTFAKGKIGELRRFVQQSYRIKEIAELPEGAFEGTGIKTYLISISNLLPGDEDIIVRRYETPKRKNRRTLATELSIAEETFVMQEELDELGDWNISKIFSQQDDEMRRFQESSIRRVPLGEVATIFRGKSVTQKDPTGGIGVINISNIREYDIDYDDLDHLEEDEFKVANFLLKDGDVLIPARGTAIRTAIFRKQEYACIASSNVIIIRPDEKSISSIYLKIFLDSPVGKALVTGMQQGTSIISISYKDLAGLEVPLPTMEEQQKVSKTYVEELKEYQDTLAAAEGRWASILSDLQKF